MRGQIEWSGGGGFRRILGLSPASTRWRCLSRTSQPSHSCMEKRADYFNPSENVQGLSKFPSRPGSSLVCVPPPSLQFISLLASAFSAGQNHEALGRNLPANRNSLPLSSLEPAKAARACSNFEARTILCTQVRSPEGISRCILAQFGIQLPTSQPV